MFSVYDPCAKCSCTKSKSFKTLCQGCPNHPGICPSAPEHWNYIAYQQMEAYECDRNRRIQHAQSRGADRKKGWRYDSARTY